MSSLAMIMISAGERKGR